MRIAGTARRPLMTVAAVLGVLAVAGVSVAWRAGGAAATQSTTLVVAQAGPLTTSSTTSSSTSTSTSTSTTSTTSTSTTVRPRPVPTTAATPRTTVPKPVAAPVTTAPAWTPPVAQPTGTSPAERCAAAKQWVAEHGLTLPTGWGFRCPGSTSVSGAERWGLACWNCEGNASSWIAVDIGRIGPSDATLRYVIAHETCHALDYTGLGITTEVGADLCAALHGAPRP